MANEKRLIDLDKAFEAIKQEVWWTESEKAYFRSFLVKQPKVDAVEVVRCKDCKHYDFGVCLKIYSDGAVSQYAWQARNEDDYCSYGERKEND